MNGRTLSGLIAVLAVVALVAIGVGGLITSYGLATPAAGLAAPTVATLLLTALVVLALVGLGSRSRGSRSSPYW